MCYYFVNDRERIDRPFLKTRLLENPQESVDLFHGLGAVYKAFHGVRDVNPELLSQHDQQPLYQLQVPLPLRKLEKLLTPDPEELAHGLVFDEPLPQSQDHVGHEAQCAVGDLGVKINALIAA